MDGALNAKWHSAYTQTLDMEKAQLVTRFSMGDKAEVSSTIWCPLGTSLYGHEYTDHYRQ